MVASQRRRAQPKPIAAIPHALRAAAPFSHRAAPAVVLRRRERRRARRVRAQADIFEEGGDEDEGIYLPPGYDGSFDDGGAALQGPPDDPLWLERLSRAERVLRHEAEVYEFAPSDAMAPSKHLIEISQEMEMLMYGQLGFYHRTLERIAGSAHEEAQQKAAARLLQSFARRNQAIAVRHARRLERLLEQQTAETIGAAIQIQAHLRGRSDRRAAAIARHTRKSALRQSALDGKLLKEETSIEHQGLLSTRPSTDAQVAAGVRTDRAHAHAQRALELAASTIQRSATAFRLRLKEKGARQKEFNELVELLARLPAGAEDAQTRISRAYRRHKDATQALSGQLKLTQRSKRSRHPLADRTLYAPHGLASIQMLLDASTAELAEASAARERLPSAAAAKARIAHVTSAVRRLRGALAFAADLLERPAMAPWPAAEPWNKIGGGGGGGGGGGSSSRPLCGEVIVESLNLLVTIMIEVIKSIKS